MLSSILALFSGPAAPVVSFFTGNGGKTLGIGIVAVGLLIGARVALNEHDARVQAQMIAAQQSAQIAQIKDDNAKVVAGLEQSNKDTLYRLSQAEALKDTISHAPVTTTCVRAPAIAAALGGLRQQPAGHH